jgi:hypothetical protein
MVVNCEHVWQEVSNYLENEVDTPLRAAMDEHFATCAHCKSVLEGMRNVVTLYADERMLEVPAGFGRRLEKSLEKKLAQSVRPGRGWSTWSAWLVPVAALLIVAGGVKLASSRTLTVPLKSQLAQPGHNIPSDMRVVVASDTRVFHVVGCPFIHPKEPLRTLTAKEALAEGYVPCLRCMRKYLDVTKSADANFEDDGDEEQTAASTEQEVVRAVRHWKEADGY